MTHTFNVGDASVTVLGIARVKRTADEVATLFADVAREEIDAEVSASVEWSFNLLLIRLADEIVLVDTGFGFHDGGPGAATADLIREAGVDPQSVTAIVITHCHGDHVGGLLVEGRPSFPDARLFIREREHAFWTGAESDALGAQRTGPVRAALAEYEEATHRVEAGTTFLASGGTTLTAVDAPGHTPGHMALDLVSGSSTLRAMADTLHTEMQLAHTGWSPRFDVDGRLAAATRLRLLDEAATEGGLVHFYHLPFPGIGRVVRSGDAYAWESI